MKVGFFRQYLRKAESDLDPPGLIEARRLKEELNAQPERSSEIMEAFKNVIEGIAKKTRPT
jgi:hypothetical protein